MRAGGCDPFARAAAARFALGFLCLLTDSMLTALRPGTGISPSNVDAVVGRRLRRPIERGQLLDPSDLE